MLTNARARALRRGLPFTITDRDINIPELCPVFGMPLAFTGGRQGGGPWSPTLDRIIPELGYIPGNVQVVSMKFNRLKSDATPQELGVAAMFMLKQEPE